MASLSNFLLSPLTALYDLDFYRNLMRSRLRFAFYYLGYVALILAIGSAIVFNARFKPVSDELIDWFEETLPVMQFTAEGMLTEVKQPYELSHPVYGSVLLIDGQRKNVTNADLLETYCIITATKAYLRSGSPEGPLEVSLIPKTPLQQAKWSEFVLSGPILKEAYQKMVPMSIPVVLIVTFVLFYLSKLISAAIFTWVAMGMSRFLYFEHYGNRSFGQWFVIASFALTPSILLQSLPVLLPALPFSVGILPSSLVTVLFLWFVLAGVKQREARGLTEL